MNTKDHHPNKIHFATGISFEGEHSLDWKNSRMIWRYRNYYEPSACRKKILEIADTHWQELWETVERQKLWIPPPDENLMVFDGIYFSMEITYLDWHVKESYNLSACSEEQTRFYKNWQQALATLIGRPMRFEVGYQLNDNADL